jgi:hypothetical protein
MRLEGFASTSKRLYDRDSSAAHKDHRHHISIDMHGLHVRNRHATKYVSTRLGTKVKVNSGAWQPSPHRLNHNPPYIQCPLHHINYIHHEVEHLKYLEHLIIHCYNLRLWSISIRFSVLASGDGCYAPELTFTFVPSLVLHRKFISR